MDQAIANKYSNNKLNTVSVRFDEAGYDESNKTELMKNYLKTNHLNVTISKKKFFNNFENIIKVKDAPISIPHEYPLYELTKQMKGKVKVVLSGEGADELFGGYSRVQKSPFDFEASVLSFRGTIVLTRTSILGWHAIQMVQFSAF